MRADAREAAEGDGRREDQSRQQSEMDRALGATQCGVIATPILAAVVLARVLGADDLQARIAAAESLLNAPLFSRIAACAALAVAGGGLARSPASARAPVWGRWVSGAAGLTLLFVLSVDWTRY